MEQRKVPEIRFRQEDGTEFPAWENTTIDKIATVVGGGTPKSDELTYWNGQIDWYTPTEIVSKYLQGSERKITEAGLKNSSAKLLPKETILLTSRASIGLCSINNTDGQVTTNQGFQSIVCNKQRAYNEFVYYSLHVPKVQHSLQSRACGSTFLEISSSEVKKTKLQAPLLIEQKKIGSFFSALDRRIILADKKLATLQTIKKGMLQKIFSQELRFRDDDGNEFPAWTEKPLGDIASVTKLAGFEFTKYVTYKDEGKIIALRGLNVKNGSLVLDDVKYIDGSDFSKLKRSKLYKGDILFTYVGTIGESAIVDKNDAYYLAPNVALVRIAHESPQYALFYMQSEQFHLELNKYVTLTSQASLTMDNVRKIKIMLPVMAEQQKIAAYFATLDRSIAAAQKKAAALRTIKKGLLQKMFI